MSDGYARGGVVGGPAYRTIRPLGRCPLDGFPMIEVLGEAPPPDYPEHVVPPKNAIASVRAIDAAHREGPTEGAGFVRRTARGLLSAIAALGLRP